MKTNHALILNEGDLVEKINKSEISKWIDSFLSKKLKNNPKKYSQKLYDSLKEYEIEVDGERYALIDFDNTITNKWL